MRCFGDFLEKKSTSEFLYLWHGILVLKKIVTRVETKKTTSKYHYKYSNTYIYRRKCNNGDSAYSQTLLYTAKHSNNIGSMWACSFSPANGGEILMSWC